MRDTLNFWNAYDNLAAAKVLENSIEGTLAYIDQEYAKKHSLLKSQIIESIKNLCMTAEYPLRMLSCFPDMSVRTAPSNIRRLHTKLTPLKLRSQFLYITHVSEFQMQTIFSA